MIFCSGSYRRQTDMDVDEFQPNRSRQRGMAASSVADVMARQTSSASRFMSFGPACLSSEGWHRQPYENI